MTKKKATSSKTTGAKAAAAAKPAGPEASVRPPKAPKEATVSSAMPAARPPFRRPQSLNFAGVGRNDICPCGSGKRFKNCHGH